MISTNYSNSLSLYNSVIVNPQDSKDNILKSRLIRLGVMDDHFDCLQEVASVPLNEAVKNRLKELFSTPLNILGETFSLREVLQAIFAEVKKLPCGHNFRPQLRGSKVLDVLGEEYARDLFQSIGIELNPKELSKIKNTKKSFDLDLGIWIDANYQERGEIIQAVEEALFHLMRSRSALPDSELRLLVSSKGFLEKPANIVDDKSQYLNTSLGDENFHVELLWIQSFARQEIFRKDARSINLPSTFLDDLGEPEVVSSENILKPFIDLLFDLLTVNDASLVNKRGLSRLHLEEAQGRELLDPSLEQKFYVTALFKCPKAGSAATYFFELVDFCNRKHAQSPSAFFILYLKMARLLCLNVGTKDIVPIREKEVEEYKKLLPRNLKFQNELFQLIYDLCLRPDLKLSDVLDVVSVVQMKYKLVSEGFTLNIRWKRAPSDQLPTLLRPIPPTLAGLKLLLALNEVIPTIALKEAIYVRLPLDLSGLTYPIAGLGEPFFETVKLLEAKHPGEGYIRAFLSQSDTLDIGMKRLERERAAIFPILKAVVSRCPVDGFKLYKKFKNQLSPQEKEQALVLLLNSLTTASTEARLKFPYSELQSEVKLNQLDPNVLDIQTISKLILIEGLQETIYPFIFQNRFIQENTVQTFVSLLSLCPLSQVDAYGPSLSLEALQVLFASKEIKKTPALACLAKIYLSQGAPVPIIFRMAFVFRFTPEEVTHSHYAKIVKVITEHLERLKAAKKEIGKPSEEAALEIVRQAEAGGRLGLILLEMGFVESPQGVDAILPSILSRLNEDTIKRVWKWAVSSSFAKSFLLQVLDLKAFEEEALLELQGRETSPEALLSKAKDLLKRKAFIPLFHLIRALERRIKTHPDWKPFLKEVFHQWLSEKLDTFSLQEGFDTYTGLSTPLDELSMLVFWKMDEGNSLDLKIKLLRYVRANYTLKNIERQEALYNLVLKNLSELASDQLREFDPLLKEMGESDYKASKPQEEKQLEILIKRRPFNEGEGPYMLLKKLDRFQKAREMIQEIGVFSQDASLFSEAIRLGLKNGFKTTEPQIDWFKRLFQIDPLLSQEFLLHIKNVSYADVKSVFSYLLEHASYYEQFESLIDHKFFHPLKESSEGKDLFLQFFNRLQDAKAVIKYGKKALFKNFMTDKRVYGRHAALLLSTLEKGKIHLIKEWAELPWRDDEALALLEASMLQDPETLEEMSPLFSRMTAQGKEKAAKTLYALTLANRNLLTSFIKLYLHCETFTTSEELEFAIARLSHDEAPENFYEFLEKYTENFLKSLRTQCEIDKAKKILEGGEGRFHYQPAGRYVKTYLPIHKFQAPDAYYHFYLQFLKRVIHCIYDNKTYENNHLRDFVIQNFYLLMECPPKWSDKTTTLFMTFIFATGQTLKRYNHHRTICHVFHWAALRKCYYPEGCLALISHHVGPNQVEKNMKALVETLKNYLDGKKALTIPELAFHLQFVLSLLSPSHNFPTLKDFIGRDYFTFVNRICEIILHFDVLELADISFEKIYEALFLAHGRQTQEVLELSSLLISSLFGYTLKWCLKYPSIQVKPAFCKTAIKMGYHQTETGRRQVQQMLTRLVIELNYHPDRIRSKQIWGELSQLIHSLNDSEHNLRLKAEFKLLLFKD